MSTDFPAWYQAELNSTADATTSSQTIAKPNVSRRFLVRMSNKKLADVMYAILITKSKLTSSYGTGIYQYNRSQNSYNGCWVMCQIPEQELDTFSQLAGVKLLDPENPAVNGDESELS